VWRGYYGDDPLHMNGEGYRVWGKSLTEYLDRLAERSGERRAGAATRGESIRRRGSGTP